MASRVQKTACQVCRSRKVACDQQRPRCGLCSKNNFDCQYKPREHQPGIRAGYVSSLERRIVALEERLSRLESRPSDERTSAAPPQQSDSMNPLNTISLGSDDLSRHNSQLLLPEHSNHPNPVSISPNYDSLRDNENPTPASLPLGNELGSTSNSYLKKDFDIRALWIAGYSLWFPVLHPTFFDAANHITPEDELLWKAITAVTVVRTEIMESHERKSLSTRLQNEVTVEALGNLSLRSVQALLVIANLVYGDGNMTKFGSLISVCKRMVSQLGIAPLCGVGYEGGRKVPAVHPSIMDAANPPLMREECIRTYWMIEMLDIIAMTGLSQNYSGLPPAPSAPILPCANSVWNLLESLDNPSLDDSPYSSGFSLCVGLAINEVSLAQVFMRTFVDTQNIQEIMEWESQAQHLDERLTNWREEFVAVVFRLLNAGEISSEMDLCITLANCVLNTTLIALLQWRTPCPKGIKTHVEPWSYATNRCVYACENMAAKIRRMDDQQLENSSPYLVFSIFVAARFFIIYTKALDADVPANLRILAFGLHTCGKRWPLARSYETVIRAAVSEHRSAVSGCTLPSEFYDPQLCNLEVADLMQKWVEHSCPHVYRDSGI